MKGYLLLEDGMVFHGTVFGVPQSTLGEVVFNTGMTGYQETLTDPSYYGQIVVMTYPLIGNYGFTEEDEQSHKPMVQGFVIREGCDSFSNWRGNEGLEDYFFKHQLTGLMDVDTRALTRHLREKGALRGKIVVDQSLPEGHKEDILGFSNSGAVQAVSTSAQYTLEPKLLKVAVMDFGIKRNILMSMTHRNMILDVFPVMTKAEEILASDPDGIFLSNGPGDPAELEEVIDEIKKMIGIKPIFGICLGHQLLAHAFGGKTKKMKYGHRGSNHPVKDIGLDRVMITSQNHGYEVVSESLDPHTIEITHVNVNDGTVEGMKHKLLPVFSVQYHPEASPGPSDSMYLFDMFEEMMQKHKEGQK